MECENKPFDLLAVPMAELIVKFVPKDTMGLTSGGQVGDINALRTDRTDFFRGTGLF